ncbi:MAG: amidohydrolase family protein [Sandaracinaceae bacterium]|nr:amidohydrolase family protein [Sandaracinaceae bacterium]
MPGLPDLHRHLDGSLRPATLDELARTDGVAIPEDLVFWPGMGLEAALSRFALTLSVLKTPDRVRRVASEICEDAAADGVTTLEIRFAPQLHEGAPIEAIVEAALDGIAGRAGLLLCGLYGEPPALVEALAKQPGIAGLDLAGGPTPAQRFSLEDYAGAFEVARARGIGRTVHASEGRPPHEIRVAIEQLHAQRIGHGTTLLEDPGVLELVLARGVTIEACPTSNWQTGAIARVDAHPLPRWLELGVKVCVNPDNTLFSNVTASEEHRRARMIDGMTADKLDAAIAFGHAAAFRAGL